MCCPACADGRGFHLLGAVVWAPLCGTLHWANNQLQAGAALQGWLARHDLIDLPLQQQQQHEQKQAAAEAVQQVPQLELETPKVPKRYEDMPWRDKILAVEAVKQRELEQLHQLMREKEEAAQAADLQERRQQRQLQQQTEQSQRKRWLLW